MLKNITATVFDIQKYSIHDGGGIRTLVFLKGCPLECLWCANPESQSKAPERFYFKEKCIECGECVQECPVQAIVKKTKGILKIDSGKCVSCGRCVESCYANAVTCLGKEYDVDSMIYEIKKDIPFYRNSNGGVTFSGGEPLLHSVFINAVARECKSLSVSVAVETCGHVSENALSCIIENENVDTVMFDIKHMDSLKHRELCMCGNDTILKNFKTLNERGKQDVVVRIPIISGLNDSKDNIIATSEFIKSKGIKVKRVDILPYHNLALGKYARVGHEYTLSKLLPPSSGRMNYIKSLIEKYDLTVQIGG
jgi:pyruvate formate lyase activating enzyme